MAWATADECNAITGLTPDAATLARAQAMVEVHVNRQPDSDEGLTPRDLYWLRAAVAWQAAWLPSQHGIDGRVASQGITQDGMSSQFRSSADIVLAPLAQRAIRNLTWMASRSIRTTNRDASSGVTDANWLRFDPEDGWDSMGKDD